MNGRMDGSTDERMDRRISLRIDVHTNCGVERQMDELKERWTEGQMDGSWLEGGRIGKYTDQALVPT